MRIVQLVSQTELGGAETYGHSLAAGLAERGHEVRLLANRANGPLLEKPRPAGLTTEALHRTSRLDPAILRFLLRHLREFRPDVLHAHNFGANTWARVLGCFFPEMAVVCHVHAGRMVTNQPARKAALERMLFRRADLVIGINQEMMDYLTGRLRVPEERALFLVNGIDMERFSPPDEGVRNQNEVVCVASLNGVKNHACLLGAWKRVADQVPGARLTLVGEGPLRPELEAQVQRLGIGESVEFAGLQTDVLPFYKRASIFTLTSHREALPLALLEAMATGAVPVASAVGGIPEVIEDGETGFLVAPGDEEGFARHLTACLSRPEETARRGRVARAAVEGKYSLGAILERLEGAYAEALARRRR
ncbi:MAG: glycosyltransferase [Candidatus Eisenbacteria bacterium]